MSDPNQEFLQSQQTPHHHQPPARGGGGGAMGGGNPQQHHHPQAAIPPQPPPPTNSGFSNSIPPQGGGPHNSRMGMGMGMGMNRNGNNHINHGMATGYTSVPPGPPEGPQGGTSGLGVGGGSYSQTEVNHFNHSGQSAQPNFNPQIMKSLPHSQLHPYDHHQGVRPNLDPRSPYANHDDMAPQHHQHQYPLHHPNGGRTSNRGGFRNFERPHPYSRPPPSDPPRHNGGWR